MLQQVPMQPRAKTKSMRLRLCSRKITESERSALTEPMVHSRRGRTWLV